MNTKKYNWLLYLITTTIVLTITIQFYWNYKNYQENKKRITNEIQISFDTAIEEYFSNLSKENFFTIISSDSSNTQKPILNDFWLSSSLQKNNSIKLKVNSLEFTKDNLTELKKMPSLIDSLLAENKNNSKSRVKEYIHLSTDKPKKNLQLFQDQIKIDSLKIIKGFKSVVIALSNDSINFEQLEPLFLKQLQKKGIQNTFYFQYSNNDSILQSSQKENEPNLSLFANAKTTYLRSNQQLKVFHTDPTISTLKKSSTGILLSLLLSLAVISSLFYLLKVINKQKELAEIKNDLISNITHEFKTPIATVSTAIEAIENFNVIHDKEKTQKYLSMSSIQLKKLHQMVEKLLETATLDSEKLMLKKEDVDLIDLITRITKKHQLLTDKKLTFSSNIKLKYIEIDLFHFENAISNLIDNAIKYGGNTIEISANSVLNHTEISIADNGNGIEKNQHEKIFDKFYRIPKGNKHDVKGFGIGLYYTKKIIEKHKGSIHLLSNHQNTIFKIILPNE